MLKCRYTQARINVYLRRELPEAQRRYIARHLNDCEACRAHVSRQRDLSHELERVLPTFGAPPKPRLETMWQNIQSQIAHPKPKPLLSGWHQAVAGGLVVLGLGFVFLSVNPLDANPPTPPIPAINVVASTPTAQAQTRAVVYVALASGTQPVQNNTVSLLQNTPDPTLSGK